MIGKTISYTFRIFIEPRLVLTELLNSPFMDTVGLTAMLFMSALYTVVIVFLAVLHGTPNPAPFLPIPSESYFYWAKFFYMPVLLSGVALAGLSNHFLSKLLGGTGSIRQTFALTAFATAAGTLPALAPDLLITATQILGFMDYGPWFYSVTHFGAWFYIVWAYLLLYIISFGYFYPHVIKTVHHLSWPRSIAVGWIGFMVYQGFIFIFLR